MITEDHYIDYLTHTDISESHPGDTRSDACGAAISSSSDTLCTTGTLGSSCIESGRTAALLEVVGDRNSSLSNRAGVLGEAGR